METIDRRVYQKPIVNVVKIDTVRLMQYSKEASEIPNGNNSSREFHGSFFEEED